MSSIVPMPSISEQYQNDLQNWLHCLRGCRRAFVLRFILTKLLPTGAVGIGGAIWLIKAIWQRHD